jgi:o-succinylbenzoate synthase
MLSLKSMLSASAKKHTLEFKTPGGTSRGVLHTKNSWIVSVSDAEKPGMVGQGEASIIEKLSPDWNSDYEKKLEDACALFAEHAHANFDDLKELPSIRFAFEAALLDLKNGGKGHYFPSEFTAGLTSIPINGLVWMGSKETMQLEIEEKLESGFNCIKLKIGAIDYAAELELLKSIRQRYSAAEVMIRVDANGAFHPDNVMQKLQDLAKLGVHSIEQPIPADMHASMQKICATTPIPIALDEELIGVNERSKKNELLSYINPQYVILKPSLLGGFKSCDEWIDIANKHSIGWWITSALESNIGLNAIAQYTFTKNNPLHHGLGTGQLFTNNFESRLYIEKGQLWMRG